jgi:hypothetical protein
MATDATWFELLTYTQQLNCLKYAEGKQHKQLKEHGSAIIMNVMQNPSHMPMISKYLPCMLRGGVMYTYLI